MKNSALALEQPFALSRSHGTLALGSLLFAALTAAGAAIAFPLPFSPVPITLQTLFVILAGAMLGPVYGPISQLLYVAAGVSGMPVFAGGAAGPGALVGPTGGYLVGFVLGAWTAGLFTRPGAGWARLLLGLLAAHGAIFVVGVAHLSVFVGSSVETALRLGVLPFLPGMVFKTAAAAAAIRSPRLAGLLRP